MEAAPIPTLPAPLPAVLGTLIMESSTKGYNLSPGPTKMTACKSPLALVILEREREAILLPSWGLDYKAYTSVIVYVKF